MLDKSETSSYRRLVLEYGFVYSLHFKRLEGLDILEIFCLVSDLGFFVFHTSTYTSTVVLCYSPLNIQAQLIY